MLLVAPFGVGYQRSSKTIVSDSQCGSPRHCRGFHRTLTTRYSRYWRRLLRTSAFIYSNIRKVRRHCLLFSQICTIVIRESMDVCDYLVKRYNKLFSKYAKKNYVDLFHEQLEDEGGKYLARFLANSSITSLNLDGNSITSEGMKYLARGIENSRLETLYLRNNLITGDGIVYLFQALKQSSIYELELSKNNLGYDGIKYIADSLKDTRITYFFLQENHLGDEMVKILSQFLPNTQVTTLNLSNNNISHIGIKHLMLTLKYTQVKILILNFNNLGNEGVKSLVDDIKNTAISCLRLKNTNITNDEVKYLAQIVANNPNIDIDFGRNYIDTDGVEPLNQVLYDAKGHLNLSYDIHFSPERPMCLDTYVSHRVCGNFKSTYIILHGNKIGMKGANYLNQTFKSNHIFSLELSHELLAEDDVDYLALAFKGVTIQQLKLFSIHINQTNGIKYLIRIFKDSSIYDLNIEAQKFTSRSMKLLTDFLKEVQVINLGLNDNSISNAGVRDLTPVLKNSSIIELRLSSNKIGSVGVKYLSEVLRDTQITTLELSDNDIDADGAKYLAEGVKHSQLVSIDLVTNRISYTGYQYLADSVDDTNITSFDLSDNDIEMFLVKHNVSHPIDQWLRRKSNVTMAVTIRETFHKLVSLHTSSGEFDFIIPAEGISDLNQYIWLIVTLMNSPHSKVHIVEMVCIEDLCFDFDAMRKINEFVASSQYKFNTFFNDQILDLVKVLGNYNYLNVVKQCEDAELCDVVKNLLLHRELFYIDNDQEILHPFIYVLLKKYGLSLYNEQLEPNKRGLIMSYFEEHLEIEGAQEIVDLLKI